MLTLKSSATHTAIWPVRTVQLAAMRRRYGDVLAAPGSAALLAASVAARLPLGMISLAIVLLVRERTGSFAAAGASVGAYALAGAATTPLLGALVDRVGRRAVLVPTATAQALLLGAFVAAALAGAPAAVLVVVAGAAGSCLPPVAACLRVLWPRIAPEPELREAAYSLDAVAQELIWTAGPVLVAVVVAVGSPAWAVGLCGALTLAGTLAFVASPLTARGDEDVHRPRRPGGALASPGLRVVLATGVLMGTCIGALEVGIPSLAVHTGEHGAAGAMLSLWSVGSIAGGLWYGARRWRRPLPARYGRVLALMALTTAPMIAARSLIAGLALSALAGIAYAPAVSCQSGLVEATAPAGAVTEAFTWLNAALAAGIAGGAALAGTLVDGAGASAAFALGCAAAAVAAAIALSRVARSVRRGPAPRAA
jgi:MFS family permease